MTKDGDPDGAMKTSYDRISYKEQAEIDAKFKEFRKDVDGVIENAGQLHTDKPKSGMTFGIGEDVNNPNILRFFRIRRTRTIQCKGCLSSKCK